MKRKFKYSLARIFFFLNVIMDNCLADVLSERVYKYRKFKIEDSSVRNMFIMSNQNYSMADETPDKVYRKFKTEDSFTRNMFRGSIMDYCLLVKHQKESMSMYRKNKIKVSLTRNMFSWSNMDYCMVDVKSKTV